MRSRVGNEGGRTEPYTNLPARCGVRNWVPGEMGETGDTRPISKK